MPISTAIVELIRDEIGQDSDFSDQDPAGAGQLDSLENIYTNTARGNYSVLRTALVCWRLRLGAWQSHAFDATTEGSLLNRSQKTKYLRSMVARYELLIETTDKAKVLSVLPLHHEEAADEGAEFAS